MPLAKRLQGPFKAPLKWPLTICPNRTRHRRAHRPGRPARIDNDPALRAFVLARIDHLTFEQLAEEITKAFPPARRIGKSGIHACWQKTHPR